MFVVFKNDDDGYLKWLQDNQSGFVLNTREAIIDPDYMVLHNASCKQISVYPNMIQNPGGFTERDYIKICSDSKEGLSEWVKQNGRADGSFSKECSKCIK